jgi:hypothetical protein
MYYVYLDVVLMVTHANDVDNSFDMYDMVKYVPNVHKNPMLFFDLHVMAIPDNLSPPNVLQTTSMVPKFLDPFSITDFVVI